MNTDPSLAQAYEIIIPLSKKKITFLALGALLLFSIGLWLVMAPPTRSNFYPGNEFKIRIAGYASVFFFGMASVFLIRKLKDKTPGLIIDHRGITDNSSALSAGLIYWQDIENISRFEIRNQNFILLQLSNPQSYINLQESMWKKKGMELNYRLYGSPIFITANSLDIGFEELFTLVNSKFNSIKTTGRF